MSAHDVVVLGGGPCMASQPGTFIHPHPSLSEATGETMLALTGRSLHG